jgi:hypothetical protein
MRIEISDGAIEMTLERTMNRQREKKCAYWLEHRRPVSGWDLASESECVSAGQGYDQFI